MQEDKDKKLNIIHTPCKECVFAEYEGNTQKSCAAGMLDKFKKSGYEIIEVYDDEQEFFVVNNKKCLFMRTKQWSDKHNFSNKKDAVTAAIDENKLKYILILTINENTTLNSVKDVLEFFNLQNILPAGILVITDKKYHLQVKINSIAKLLDSYQIKWRIQKFIDDLDFTQKIKAIIQSAPVNRFYFYIDPIEFDSKDLNISFINDKILDGLVFGCLKVGGGLFFSYLSWQYAKLNKGIDILLNNEFHISYEDIK